MILWGRRARATIGPAGSTGVLIGSLRLAFSVEKTITPEPNRARIEIYNLAADTSRDWCVNGNIVILDWGYAGLPPVTDDQVNYFQIFKGSITHAVRERRGTEVVTYLECGDGQRAWDNAEVNVSFKPGAANVKLAIGSLVEQLKAEGVSLAADFKDKLSEMLKDPKGTFEKGLSMDGPVNRAFDRLTRRFGYSWSMQDEVVQIHPEDDPAMTVLNPDQADAALIGPESGLIGAPTLVDSGLRFDCLIIPGLKPGWLVKLPDTAYESFWWILQKISMRADTHGPANQATCECKLWQGQFGGETLPADVG